MKIFRLCSLLLLGLTGITSSRACNVPVFRYALEHWPADPYEITIFHRGELTGTVKTVADALTQAGEQSANLAVTTVDVTGEIPRPVQALWQSNQTAALPLMAVQYPASSRKDWPCWIGAPANEVVGALLDSPARRELARRLLRGDSAVWLFLEGADKAANDSAAARLEATLARAQNELLLPASDPNDPPVSEAIPVKIQFSLLRLSRDDPAEKFLIAMLLGTGSTFAAETGPIVFPVFGRGRVLFAFTEERLNPESIISGAEFMCGACSCEVKDRNPGVDLLMSTDWDKQLIALNESATTTNLNSSLKTETVTISGSDATPVATTGRNDAPLLAGAAVLLLVLLGLAYGKSAS